MNKNRLIRIMVLVIGTILLLITANYLLKKKNPNLSILSPVSKSFSILSFRGKREPPKKTIYGYLPYWSIKDAKYLQLDKLTDIAYFGLYIDEKGDFIKYENGEINPGYNNWINNKDLDNLIKNVKKYDINFALTIISHVDETSDKFLDCRECWDNLATNIIEELLRKDIRDVNLNFEYAELTPVEKAVKYTEFTEFINNKLDETFGESNLVVATFADSLVKDRVTKINDLGKAADKLFIMAYDFHRPTSDNAGPVAPIGGKGVYAEYDISTMLKDYLSYVPPNKLILGVPYYGYNWVVESYEEYAKRINGEEEIGFSQSQTYNSIMETLLLVKPEIKWDELAQSPYFTYISPETGSIREVYFDDARSLRIKYNLVNEHDLAGVGIWALGYDGGYNELWNLLEESFIK